MAFAVFADVAVVRALASVPVVISEASWVWESGAAVTVMLPPPLNETPLIVRAV
jgi:hypothetical protein